MGSYTNPHSLASAWLQISISVAVISWHLCNVNKTLWGEFMRRLRQVCVQKPAFPKHLHNSVHSCIESLYFFFVCKSGSLKAQPHLQLHLLNARLRPVSRETSDVSRLAFYVSRGCRSLLKDSRTGLNSLYWIIYYTGYYTEEQCNDPVLAKLSP